MFVRVENFRGRNETLTGIAAFGYDPSFGISYYNPNVIGKEDIFFTTGFTYTDVSNKSPLAENIYGAKFSQKFFRWNLLFGKRFFLFHKLYTSFAYTYLETPEYFPGVNVSGGRIDRFPEIGFGYEYDTRDLLQFPRDGIFATANFTFKGFGVNNIDYKISRFDFREYRKVVDKLTAKWRLAARFATGNEVPYYDNSILGLDDRIRGYFSRKTEGNHYYFASLEMYYPIIEEWIINLDFIPLIPKKLLSYRVALYTQLFGDTGAAQFRGDPFSLNKFKSGYGAGISIIILPYNILRIEYALDEKRNSEWIFDLGISF